ncbi:SRPBCC family protein [Halobacillus litoralis]|uniref:SRPBCC family protein n=1 Tax=Halobacillus litoralis TaxID=45668 RepID=UPI001CD4E804|nr:SRPBCC family protein [Halobacillus litoralis]MCA0971226.1 SRPBCC family protein [Halobacillus litoralis]
MSFFTQTITIQKPIDEVFAAATDFKNSPEIMDAVVDVELLTEGPVREGFQFKETREIRGRRVPSKINVTHFEKNKAFSVRSVQQGLDLRYHYTFTETTEGTKVDFRGELFTEGLRNKLTQPLIKKIIKKEDENHLKHLKNFIESSS